MLVVRHRMLQEGDLVALGRDTKVADPGRRARGIENVSDGVLEAVLFVLDDVDNGKVLSVGGPVRAHDAFEDLSRRASRYRRYGELSLGDGPGEELGLEEECHLPFPGDGEE